MVGQRLFFFVMLAAIAAVFISIIIANHPPLPEPGPELKCTEWHERILVRVDYGPTGVLRTCSQYTWSQR